jgi:regulatory protein
MDKNEAKLRAAKFCAYQERAPFEVEEKLKSFGLNQKHIDQILRELSEDGYVNENRFANIYAKGKFRNNKWGKIKIRQHLLFKQIPKEVAEQGIMEIPDEEYEAMIKNLIKNKCNALEEPDLFIKNNKIASYLIQKGFEPDLVWKFLREDNPSDNF